jgi:hypothetical protein
MATFCFRRIVIDYLLTKQHLTGSPQGRIWRGKSSLFSAFERRWQEEVGI